jgi:WD40 repeat protein
VGRRVQGRGADRRLTDTFAGYFGALNCVAWSPDSRFVAVGGQDDLITIFSARESRVVARCQGHSAFVLAITFDYTRGGGYRFGSVGEDGKLVLVSSLRLTVSPNLCHLANWQWDFTAAQLHRPRHHHPNASHHRLAAGSTLSLGHGASKSHLPLGTSATTTGVHYHPAPPRSEVALLQPVMVRSVFRG